MRSRLHRLSWRAEQAWDGFRARFDRGPRRLTVVPYLASGSTRTVFARGRVLENAPVTAAEGAEHVVARMRRMARRFLTDEVPGVEVEVRIGGVTERGVTDEEGYYGVRLEAVDLAGRHGLLPMDVEVVGRFATLPVEVLPAQVSVPAPGARRLVVSDLDDTVLRTGAARLGRMILTTATGSVVTRTAFDAVAELYAGLVRGAANEDNPVAYVSSSPWNLYDFLIEFIRRSSLPTGPLFLRDLGIDEHKFVKGGHGDHKLAAIEELMTLHPLPVVLSGDTGQADPEIYRQVIRDFPGRVDGVLLRHEASDDRRRRVEVLYADADVPLAVSASSTTLAEAASAAGLAPAEWGSRVAAIERG